MAGFKILRKYTDGDIMDDDGLNPPFYDTDDNFKLARQRGIFPWESTIHYGQNNIDSVALGSNKRLYASVQESGGGGNPAQDPVLDTTNTYWIDIGVSSDDLGTAAYVDVQAPENGDVRELDTTDDRVMVVGAFGSGATLDLRFTKYVTGKPTDVKNGGMVSGLCDGNQLNIPWVTNPSYGVLTVDGQGLGASPSYNEIYREFTTRIGGGQRYIQFANDANNWGSWKRFWHSDNFQPLDTVKKVFPVGSIYTNASDQTNPSTLFGFGTWVKFGQGKVLVGHDPSDGDFNVAGETGGEKNHTLSVGEMPKHGHTGSTSANGGHNHSGVTSYSGNHRHSYVDYWAQGNTSGGPFDADHHYGGRERQSQRVTAYAGNHNHSFTTNWQGNHTHTVYIGQTGGNQAHNNLQPYIVVYMWVRTA